MGNAEDVIRTAAAGRRLWRKRHPEEASSVRAESRREEEMVFGFSLFMMEAIRKDISASLIDTLQYGLDRGFDYYMKDLDTAVATAPFARLRNLYDFRNVPEEEVVRDGGSANLLEAAVWCLITTTTLQQVLMKAADMKDIRSDIVVLLAGTFAASYYTAADLPPEWSDTELAGALRNSSGKRDDSSGRFAGSFAGRLER